MNAARDTRSFDAREGGSLAAAAQRENGQRDDLAGAATDDEVDGCGDRDKPDQNRGRRIVAGCCPRPAVTIPTEKPPVLR
jgi:hypothetical protein